jgi:hypothetical protein
MCQSAFSAALQGDGDAEAAVPGQRPRRPKEEGKAADLSDEAVRQSSGRMLFFNERIVNSCVDMLEINKCFLKSHHASLLFCSPLQ